MANSQVDTDEELILIVVGALAAPTLLGLLVAFWDQAVGWAVGAGWLVPAAEHPLLGLPGAAGAGLDLPRVAVVGGALGLLLVWPVMLARRAWRRRQVIR